jgi:hypothetical protein
MNVRHILVAVATAALVTGSSYGALAGGKSMSKGCGCDVGVNHSSSGVLSIGIGSSPAIAGTIQGGQSTSYATGGGGAGGDYYTTGGATASKSQANGGNAQASTGASYTQASGAGATASAATAWGTSGGSSCAGSGC